MILKDKTVVITGVGDGLGRECAESAFAQGANLVIAARSQDSLAKLARRTSLTRTPARR